MQHKVIVNICERCHHAWLSRADIETPKKCKKCASNLWNIKRKNRGYG